MIRRTEADEFVSFGMGGAALSGTVPAAGVTDRARLEALESYEILDTPPEQSFDDIVQLAALICETPVALVSLVAEDRQWFKAKVGFSGCQTDLSRSVCVHALTEPDLLMITDLAADPRTRQNPLVAGDPHIRFYAGAPLRDRDGHVLGSLCVIDGMARPAGLLEHQANALRSLGRQVVALLELRRSLSFRDSFIARRRQAEQRLGEDHVRLQLSEAHWRRLFERLNEGFAIGELIRDQTGRVTDWRHLDVNAAWGKLLGVTPDAAIGHTVRELFPGIEEDWVQDMAQVVDSGDAISVTRQIGPLQRWYDARAFPLDDDQFAILLTEVTGRIRAETRRNALLDVIDQLRDLTDPAAMTAKACAIVGQALGVSRVAVGQLDSTVEIVQVESDWTRPGVSSIAGRHRLADYGDLRQGLLLGEPLVIRDVLTDPRIAADPAPMLQAGVRALVNIPIHAGGRIAAVFVVHDTKPRHWRPETIGFLRDVADRLTTSHARLKAEADQLLLNEELSHRMKNMLAMVQAIASQTLKRVSEQDAVASFRNRVQALATAHDVLLQTSWTSAPLQEVIQVVLTRSIGLEHITIDGPAVRLGPRATLSLSLLLHELATNASKYGALSVDGGRVIVAWQIDRATDELVFTWLEAGGPPATEPASKGFGTKLLRSGLIGTGGVTLRYLPTGFEAEMRAGIEQVQAS